jgi:hypothetical protein
MESSSHSVTNSPILELENDINTKLKDISIKILLYTLVGSDTMKVLDFNRLVLRFNKNSHQIFYAVRYTDYSTGTIDLRQSKPLYIPNYVMANQNISKITVAMFS